MPKKRASNGMGSIRQRPDGRWEARYTAPNGAQRSVYAKSEAEVTRKLRNALHDIDSGAWREPSALTVEQWAEIWLRDYQQHTTPQTVKTYRSVINSRVVPIIGAIRLSKLSSLHIRRLVTSMTEEGLAASYIAHCLIVMSALFSSAVEAGALTTNPAKSVKPPRADAKAPTIIDREIIPEFIRASGRTKYGLPAIFALYTGLRLGELRGLLWDDLNGSTLTVQRQLLDSGAFTVPKNGSSRTIELTPEALEILRRQRVEQATDRLHAGPEWKDTGLIFTTRTGAAFHSSYFRSAVRAIGKSIGLPSLHPHDLRHSYAVAALRAGADVKTVQHNLGHKSASMTLDVYAAYTTDAGKVGAERLSAYLKNALKQPN